MALADLSQFNKRVFTTATEIIRQKLEVFNAASRGTMVLRTASNGPNYNEESFFKDIPGLVRRRNPNAATAVSEVTLQTGVKRDVKVAAGTPPINVTKAWYKWINESPEVASATIAQQLAPAMLRDMLTIAIGCVRVALNSQTAVVHDATAGTDKKWTIANQITTASKFGDRSNEILAWVGHSASLSSFYLNNATNAQNLFTYEGLNVLQDPFGRLFLQTDDPNLIVAGTPEVYHILGLVAGAVTVEQNNDFYAVLDERTGEENIKAVYQAEWSYNVAVKGFAWDAANGGIAPNNAALLTATNWDKIAGDNKSLAGVVCKTNL